MYNDEINFVYFINESIESVFDAMANTEYASVDQKLPTINFINVLTNGRRETLYIQCRLSAGLHLVQP